MKKFGTLMTVLLGLTLIGACSGTQEPSLPTLLVVGIESGGQRQLALFEDVLDTDAPPTTPRLRLLPGGTRDIAAPAVSLDLTDRNLGRDTAWVLSREVSGTGAATQVASFLYRFSVSAIDPDSPTAFQQLDEVLLVDDAAPGTGVLGTVGRAGGGMICPSEVRSSRTGSHLLILDDPSACVPSTSDFPAMWLVHTSDWSARQLEIGNNVLGVPPHTDQASTTSAERGYFLVGAAGASTQVYVVNFETERAEPLPEPLMPADGALIVDLTVNGSLFVAMTVDGLAWLQLGDSEELGRGTRSLDTPQGIVSDTSGALRQLIVWNGNQVGLHDDAEEDITAGSSEDTVSFGAAAAVIDPARSWGYVIGHTQVLIIDLLTILGDSGTLRENYLTQPVPEMELPTAAGRRLSVVSWVRAAEPPPTP